MDRTRSVGLLGALIALLVASCSGDEPAAGSSTTDTIPPTTTTVTTSEAVDDSAQVDIVAMELEDGIIDPLPMDADTAQCTAEGIIGSLGAGEGQSLQDHLVSSDDAVADETVDLLLATYFECSEPAAVGDALATSLIETIGLPAEGRIRSCLSERLDSADEVRGVMGSEGGATDPIAVLEGCVGLGDVMSGELGGLTEEQVACLNRDGEDLLVRILAERGDQRIRSALRPVLEGCSIDPVPVPCLSDLLVTFLTIPPTTRVLSSHRRTSLRPHPRYECRGDEGRESGTITVDAGHPLRGCMGTFVSRGVLTSFR